MFKLVALRHLLALVAATAIVAWFGMPYIDSLLSTWSRVRAESRALELAHALVGPLSRTMEGPVPTASDQVLNGLPLRDRRLVAVVLCRPDGTVIARTAGYAAHISCP